MSQLTLTDADQRFSSWQTLSSKRQNFLSDVRVDKRDLEFSFGGLHYSPYSLFSYKISIEIIRRPWFLNVTCFSSLIPGIRAVTLTA